MPVSSPQSALIIGASRGLGRAFQSCEDDAVDGRNCANSGRSPAAWPTGHIDPKRAFELHPTTLLQPRRCKALLYGSSKRNGRASPRGRCLSSVRL